MQQSAEILEVVLVVVGLQFSRLVLEDHLKRANQLVQIRTENEDEKTSNSRGEDEFGDDGDGDDQDGEEEEDAESKNGEVSKSPIEL